MGSDMKASSASIPNKEKIKAVWSLAVHEIFVDVCLEETLKGNKPGTFFNKEGWKNVEESFWKNSGLRYDRKQLKNHWDLTKGQWKVWGKLTGTSSMGWDPDTQTFAASEDDWANYIQANPDAAQFRFKVPMFANKLGVIFDGASYSGETQATPRPAQRRRISDSSTTTPLLPSNEIVEATPLSRNDCFYDAVESKSIVTAQSSQGKLSYSIGECIECLDGMNEIEPGSDLYLFALDIFLKKEYREVFLQLKKPSVRVAWLQRMESVGPPLPLH